jgi:hypothetical protein
MEGKKEGKGIQLLGEIGVSSPGGGRGGQRQIRVAQRICVKIERIDGRACVKWVVSIVGIVGMGVYIYIFNSHLPAKISSVAPRG